MMEYHTLTGILDLMTGDDFKDFCEDVAENGLLEPIWLFQDQIIDGRNRNRACLETGVEPIYREWQGEEDGVLSFILSVNLHRRHLTVSQRAMLATRVLPIMEELAREAQEKSRAQQGEQAHLRAPRSSGEPQTQPHDREAAARAGAAVGVSSDSVRKAQRITQGGSPALQNAVTSGQLSVNQAAPLASLSPEEQLRCIQEAEAAPRKPGHDEAKIRKQIPRTCAKLCRQAALLGWTAEEALARYRAKEDQRRAGKMAA